MNQDEMKQLEDTIKREHSNVAGVVVMKNDKVLYENYFNECTTASTINVFSVTKSIISILIGIAIDMGYIKSIDQKVLDFFPNYKVKRKEKTINDITLRNLLTMTAPYKYWLAPYKKHFTSDDWVKSSLDLLGGHGKVGKFRYTPLIGPDILSGILVNSTGQSLLEFARKNLFSPLDITVDKNIIFETKQEQMAFTKATDISGWVSDSMGVNTAGWGLTLTPMDMAKIGQLYLNRGKWNNKQIVSTKWIDNSTKKHSRWEKHNLPYGYLWWIIDEEEKICAAMGDGGNVIYFDGKKEIVVSIASLFKPRAKDRISLIRNNIVPLFENCD